MKNYSLKNNSPTVSAASILTQPLSNIRVKVKRLPRKMKKKIKKKHGTVKNYFRHINGLASSFHPTLALLVGVSAFSYAMEHQFKTDFVPPSK